jgi:hypothetical protein
MKRPAYGINRYPMAIEESTSGSMASNAGHHFFTGTDLAAALE